MTDEDWVELERLSGVPRAEHEQISVMHALTWERRELGKELSKAQHVAQALLRRPGETGAEWYERRQAMSAEEQALVELVEHTRWVRQDVSKALRNLRNGDWIEPIYPEVRAIAQPVLDQQKAETDRHVAEQRAYHDEHRKRWR